MHVSLSRKVALCLICVCLPALPLVRKVKAPTMNELFQSFSKTLTALSYDCSEPLKRVLSRHFLKLVRVQRVSLGWDPGLFYNPHGALFSALLSTKWCLSMALLHHHLFVSFQHFSKPRFVIGKICTKTFGCFVKNALQLHHLAGEVSFAGSGNWKDRPIGRAVARAKSRGRGRIRKI